MARPTKIYTEMYKTVNILFTEEDINMMSREEFFQAYDEVVEELALGSNPTKDDESRHWDNVASFNERFSGDDY